MSARLKASDIKARLAPLAVSFPGLYLGTGYDVDFTEQFREKFDALWVVSQRSSKSGEQVPGQGYAGKSREEHLVEFLLTLNTPRIVPGSNNLEDRIEERLNAANALLLGWHMDGTRRPFRLMQSSDGAANVSFAAVNFVIGTFVVY